MKKRLKVDNKILLVYKYILLSFFNVFKWINREHTKKYKITSV